MASKILVVYLTVVASVVIAAPAFAQQTLPEAPLPLLQIPTTLDTGPLRGDDFECLVVNVGNDPMTVSAKLFDGYGSDVSLDSYCTGQLAPHASCSTHACIRVTTLRFTARSTCLGAKRTSAACSGLGSRTSPVMSTASGFRQ